jgi:hypothetical protein
LIPVDPPRKASTFASWKLRRIVMSLPNLAEIYRQQMPGASGSLAVHVALRTAASDPKTLQHLGNLGLTVQTVVGNTVVGVIPTSRLADLQHDPLVTAVEPAVALKPHGK